MDTRVLHQNILHFAAADILPAAHDNIFLAAGDFNVAVSIHAAQVTAVVPAILIQRAGSQLGFIQIPHKYVGAT
ncbi:hypothetical protein D3C77_601340 [compost metagenome]